MVLADRAATIASVRGGDADRMTLSFEICPAVRWRTVKYEEVYLHAYSDGWDAETQPGPLPVEVLPCKTTQYPGR